MYVAVVENHEFVFALKVVFKQFHDYKICG